MRGVSTEGMNPPALTHERTRQIAAAGEQRFVKRADTTLDHVLAELRRLDLDGVMTTDGSGRIVRRDSYGGSFELGLTEFSELAETVADGSGLRGFTLARDGFRDDGLLRTIDAELERCGIAGYAARHRTSREGNGIAVTDVRGGELPRPARDPHGRELLRLLGSLAGGSGLAAYTVALVEQDDHRLAV
jgi:hypothetical protein